MNFTEAEILGQVNSFIWPLMRISAMFIAVPLFSYQGVPPRIRLILALAVTFVVMPILPALSPVEIFSYAGLMVALQQVLIGLAIGFIIQMVFTAINFAGQSIALSMGLGFASMVDPQNGQQVPIISQLYTMTGTLVFLSLDGHLLLVKMLSDSFTTLPIGPGGLVKTDLWTLIAWSSRMFTGGILLAMPLVISLLLVNIGFGVATRAAPQLNIFSVGIPVTLMLGLALVWLTFPEVLAQFAGMLTDGYDLIGQLLGR